MTGTCFAQGVGDDGAPVYVFFVADLGRFARQKAFRRCRGIVPESGQSGNVEKKGLLITKVGPDVVKKYAYINAELAQR